MSEDTGTIRSIQTCPGERLPMRQLEESELVDGGIPGDAHFAPGSIRQLLLIEAETLAALGIEPATVKENLTVEGVSLMGLPAGTRLEVGDAELEVTKECEPCSRMDEIRDGLRAELVGQRGMLARVTRPGTVRRGDPVRVLQPAPAGGDATPGSG
jgi:MOSC domain-containing protein YiiM